jgi:hypothetical protein
MPGEPDFEYEWSKLVAKAWDDPALKQRLLADPAGVLQEHGLSLPAGVQVKVVENTDQVVHLTLPAKPSPAELSLEELDRVAGGHCRGCGGCRQHGGCVRCRCERCRCEGPHR